MTRYYPVNLDVQAKPCLVVGGGPVGERKVRSLLDCGAQVTVIAPEATGGLKELAEQGLIDLQLRGYGPADMAGRFLVIGATNDESLNHEVARDAAQRGVLCNIADRPAACSFVLPAVMRKGHLLIAISTSNQSPAAAKWIRRLLERQFGPEYALAIELMGAIRAKLRAEDKGSEKHKKDFEQLFEEGLVHMIRERRYGAIDERLQRVLGDAYTWRSLMGTADSAKEAD